MKTHKNARNVSETDDMGLSNKNTRNVSETDDMGLSNEFE